MVQSCSMLPLKLSLQNLRENISAGASFFKKLFKKSLTKGKKRKALEQVLSCEFREIYQNTNFEEYLRTAAMTTRFRGGVLLYLNYCLGV